jgi:hypothetical protein
VRINVLNHCFLSFFFVILHKKLVCYVKNIRLKYITFFSLLFIDFCLHAQNNDATVNIVGNPLSNDNPDNNFSNNVIQNAPPPPVYQQFATTDQNIEPTLENGFHMRFQLESPASVERVTSIGSSSSFAGGSAGGTKVRKRTISMSERSFNFKKKLKNWLPKRKKKYHPTLCEKFR